MSPALTTMSPAPTVMSSGTYTTGTQPVATYYATPMQNTDVYDQPLSHDGASWIVRDEVVADVLLSIDASHDDLRRSGSDLHGRAGPDLLPECPAQVWPVPALAAASHAGVHGAGLWNPDVLNLGLRGSREYDLRLRHADVLHDNLYIAGRDTTRQRHDDDPARHDRREHVACLHADDTQCSQRNIRCHDLGPCRASVTGSDTSPDGAGATGHGPGHDIAGSGDSPTQPEVTEHGRPAFDAGRLRFAKIRRSRRQTRRHKTSTTVIIGCDRTHAVGS